VQGTTGGTGSQGAQGTQGIQGLQGLLGAQGYLGNAGAQGAQGTQGLQGTSGAQGTAGAQGYLGNAGAQGTQGTQGLQGIQGLQGAQGAQGTQGTQGTSIQGTQGSQGTQGTQGTQGLQGIQGIQGLQGYLGNSGSQGTQGTQGIQGNLGNQGVQGTTGGTGSQGATLGVSLVSGSSYRSLGIIGTATATNNQTFYTPFFVPNSVTLNQLACITSSTFSGSASVRLGIYNDNNGLPNTVLLDAGTVSPVSSSTLYGITISQSLSSGIYWLASNVITAATTNTYVGFATGTQTQIVGMPVVTLTSTANGTAFGYTQSVNASSGFTTAGTLSVPSVGTSPLVQVKVQ